MCEIGAATLAHETLAEEADDVDWDCRMADGRRPAEIGCECWEAATQWGSALDGAAWGGRLDMLEVVAAGSAPPGFEPVNFFAAAVDHEPTKRSSAGAEVDLVVVAGGGLAETLDAPELCE